MAAFALLIGSAALAYVAVAYVKRWALAHQVMDIPNARSSHTRPTPRGGGLGMVAAFVVAFLVVQGLAGGLTLSTWAVLLGALAVAFIGFLDDRHHLPARARFAVHLGSAMLVVLAGVRLETLSLPPYGEFGMGPLGAVFSVVWIVSATNIYNFMDGIDGIAAGVAVLIGGGLALLAALQGGWVLVLLACALAGSALGFLGHNFPPATIFMGDVGSGFLGFLLASLVLLAAGASGGSVPFLAAASLLAPFLLDGSMTLIRRILKGERWYEAHRSHYYQRLVILGYSHRAVSLLYYVLTTLAALGALAYTSSPSPLSALALVLAVASFLLLSVIVPRLEARAPRAVTSSS